MPQPSMDLGIPKKEKALLLAANFDILEHFIHTLFLLRFQKTATNGYNMRMSKGSTNHG